jgi:predicted PurR-regulated permease PerM
VRSADAQSAPHRAASPITPQTGGPSGRAVYVGILLIFVLAVGSYFIHQIAQVVLALLVTLLLAVILSWPVNYLARRGLSRGLATALVAGAIGLVFWLLGMLMAPVVEQQARQFVESLPGLLEEVEALVVRSQDVLGLQLGVGPELENLPEVGREFLSSEAIAATAGFGRTVATGITLGLVSLVAAVYLVVRPYPVADGFVALFPASQRQRVREILDKVYRTVQRWLLGQMVAMAFIGVSSAVALWALGIPFALLLGLFGGLISFIPFVGAVASAIPPVLLALTSDPILAVWVILVYTAIQQIESNLIQPIVMSHAVALHPAVVLFGLLIMGTLFGIVGLLLAVPLTATVQVLIRELWVERMNRAGTDPNPPDRRKESARSGPFRRALLGLQTFYRRHR